MYIAFKWLIALAMVLWLGLCCLDIYLKESKKIILDSSIRPHEVIFTYKNVSLDKQNYGKESPKWKFIKQNNKQHSMAFLHYIMFLAGAFAVSLFNKKSVIIRYTKKRIAKINIGDTIKFFKINFSAINLKRSPNHVSVATFNYGTVLWENIRNLISKLMMLKSAGNAQNINLTLLKRVKEIGQDRKTLGQLLLTAIDENKNIRMQCQLETMAKNRLVRYVEDTQKLIKENRTHNVSFQQLYLVTHRENIFLKCRVKKLADEKDDAEKKLMQLVNEVYRSQNNDLKAYCTRFIVDTKKNLLNSDIRAEIRKFLGKSQESDSSCSEDFGFEVTATGGVPECSRDINLANLVYDAPKLRGLPGECVWTVKDKNGIIEKLYEYNFETDYDNGDTIRRIREYSVYYDKDCLLDHTNLLPQRTIYPSLSANATRLRLDIKPLKKQRFLTGSKEFKIFLKNAPSTVLPRVQASPLPCG